MSLLLVMGIPASGKSTLCQIIAAASSHSAQTEVVEFDRVVGRRVEDFNAAEARNAFEQAIKLKMERFGANWQVRGRNWTTTVETNELTIWRAY